jgi:hypothetical protein
MQHPKKTPKTKKNKTKTKKNPLVLELVTDSRICRWYKKNQMQRANKTIRNSK